MTPSPETKTMTEKLMPCPFCGGPAVRKDDPGVVNVPFGLVVDHALGCFLAMPFCTDDEAIDRAWNTRHPTPAADEVEAVARAIYLAMHGDKGGRWECVDPRYQDQVWGAYARAAIAAMQARSADLEANLSAMPEELIAQAKPLDPPAEPEEGGCAKYGNVVPLAMPENIELQGNMDPASLLAHLAEEGAMESIGYVNLDDVPPHIRAMHEDLPAEPAGDEPVAAEYNALIAAGFDDYAARCALQTEDDDGFCHAYFYSDGQWRFQTGGGELTDRQGKTTRCVLKKRLYARPATPTNPERLVEAAKALIEFDGYPTEAKRPDVFRRRMDRLAAALSAAPLKESKP